MNAIGYAGGDERTQHSARLLALSELTQQIGLKQVQRRIRRNRLILLPFAHACDPALSVGACALETHELRRAPSSIGRVEPLQLARMRSRFGELAREVQHFEFDLARTQIGGRSREQSLNERRNFRQMPEANVGLKQTAHRAHIALVTRLHCAKVTSGGHQMLAVGLGKSKAALGECKHDLEVIVVSSSK